jgi:hypothetical protein
MARDVKRAQIRWQPMHEPHPDMPSRGWHCWDRKMMGGHEQASSSHEAQGKNDE